MRSFLAGIALGGLLAGVGGALLLPISASVPPPPRPDPIAAPAPPRHRAAVACPPAAPWDASALDDAERLLNARAALLRGQLTLDRGTDLPPPTEAEQPAQVQAWLEALAPDGAEMELDCSEHPCVGRVRWQVPMQDRDSARAANEHFLELQHAFDDDYPDGYRQAGVRVDDASTQLEFLVESVFGSGAEPTQRRRMEHLIGEFRLENTLPPLVPADE